MYVRLCLSVHEDPFGSAPMTIPRDFFESSATNHIARNRCRALEDCDFLPLGLIAVILGPTTVLRGESAVQDKCPTSANGTGRPGASTAMKCTISRAAASF
mmetsp:Transcript_43940/g.103957  ORF Transcript_43940/g.103957 Transcript_43940/m.103957 type:complete len:101 (+) Transcript_43940:41-343(+)